MDPATKLNLAIDEQLPAAGRALSELGRRAYFPVDIPAQSAEARGCAINATIGEVTDGRGHPLSLPMIADHFQDVDPAQIFLYAPQGGQPALRQAWGERLRRRGDVPMSLPLVTCGITQGISLVGDLFVENGTDVILPHPCWGNYRFIFGVSRGARLHYYPSAGKEGLDLDGLGRTLETAGGRGVLVLNFPGNPTGYTPTEREAARLVELIRAQPGPLVVVLDDAYQDMVWEQGLMRRSLFYELAGLDPDRVLAVKVDGATKELFFFGARVGFLTVGASGPGADGLVEKVRGLLRARISAVPTASQTLVRLALSHPELESQRAGVLAEIERRYQALKTAMAEQGLGAYAFNSGFFALVPVSGDAEAIRRRLITEASVGVVSFAEFGALRLSYGSTRVEDIPRLVSAIRERVQA